MDDGKNGEVYILSFTDGASYEATATVDGATITFTVANSGDIEAGPQEDQIKVACIGDSITYDHGVTNWETENYPAVLQTLFEDQTIRTAWDEENEEWYFSIVDVVGVFTDAMDYDAVRNYWKVTKHRMIKEGNELVTNCNQLKLKAADGKKRLTDVANTEQLLRIIQSIPSKKAEPFK